jgi:ribosome-binding protein aMBF1 (putative translation factor)
MSTITVMPNLVRVAREHRGLSKEHLAAEAYITVQTVYRMEEGKVKTHRATRKTVADVLGFTVEELWPAPGSRSSAPELREAGKVGR